MNQQHNPSRLTLQEQLLDFKAFLSRPNLRRFHPIYRTYGIQHLSFISTWVVICLGFNIFIFAPLFTILQSYFELTHTLEGLGTKIPWAMAIIWAPIVEELIFRMGLRRPLQWFYLSPLIIAIFVFGFKHWLWVLTIGLSLALLIFYFRPTLFSERLPIATGRWYHRHYKKIIHLSALTFGFIHLSNYQLVPHVLLLAPLLVLPQLFMAYVLSWVRIRCSLSSSILLHALYNLIPSLLIMMGPSI